jgi:hypothetical protein
MRRTNTYNKDLTQTMNIPAIFKANIEAAAEIMDFFVTQKNVDKESLVTAIEEILPNYSQDYSDSITQFPIEIDEKWKSFLEEFNLAERLKNVFFTSINFKNYADKVEEGKIVLDMEDAVPGYYLCEFSVAKALTEILPFEQALDYIREYTTMIHERSNPRRKTFDKLSDFREWLELLCKDSHQFISDIKEDDSEYYFYVTKCWWAEALQKYQEPEIFTALLCHGDFASATQYSENFILTRNKTRMGYNCCDFCYHDRRKTTEISHLSNEGWERLKK